MPQLWMPNVPAASLSVSAVDLPSLKDILITEPIISLVSFTNSMPETEFESYSGVPIASPVTAASLKVN